MYNNVCWFYEQGMDRTFPSRPRYSLFLSPPSFDHFGHVDASSSEDQPQICIFSRLFCCICMLIKSYL